MHYVTDSYIKTKKAKIIETNTKSKGEHNGKSFKNKKCCGDRGA